jgi:hypothetical protein
MAGKGSLPKQKAMGQVIRFKDWVSKSGESYLRHTIHSHRRSEEAGSDSTAPEKHQPRLPELEKLLAASNDHWVMEDGVYRFYHQSFKVYDRLQPITLEITKALQQLLPHHELNGWFADIVAAGTQERFTPEHNRNWMKHTRPILEAFFHAHFMLKMVCKYGKELSEPPRLLPSGWAAVLYLFNLR